MITTGIFSLIVFGGFLGVDDPRDMPRAARLLIALLACLWIGWASGHFMP